MAGRQWRRPPGPPPHPDQNSCRPLRPNGNNSLIEASPTLATTSQCGSPRQELVPPLKVAATNIDTTGSARPRSTRGRGRRALASNGDICHAAMQTNRRRAAGHRQGQSVRRHDPGSTSRTSSRPIAAIRDFFHAPSERCRDPDRQRKIFSLGGGETELVLPGLESRSHPHELHHSGSRSTADASRLRR